MATVDWAIQRAFLHAQRKATAPATGSSKYNALLGIADSMQKMWQTEPDVEWDSLYSLETLDSAVTATDTFDLSDGINYIRKRENDFILLTDGTSTRQYRLVKPDQLYQYRESNVVARIGSTLKFPKEFASDSSLLGYSIQVPAVLYVDDITNGNQTIQVDDPMWLVYMMAAEFVRNDVVKANQYDNLLALADQTMRRMKQNNTGQTEEVSRDAFMFGESW